MADQIVTSRVEEVDFSDALGERYLAYALSTITSRSLPDVRDGLKPVQRELYSARPTTMVFFEPIFTDPARPSLRAKGAIMLLSKRRAAGILRHIFYISGRLFDDVTHRENMMRTPMTLMQNRFGSDVATDEMRVMLPNLCR